MAKADFWKSNQEEISRSNQESSLLRESIEQWGELDQKLEDAEILVQMAIEEEDLATLGDIEKEILCLENDINKLEIQAMFSDPDDKRNAIVAINAGAGGTEAQDWVEML